MAVIGTCYSLRPPHLLLLLSLVFTTVSVHFTVSAFAEKTSEATSNPNLESKADSTTSAWCIAKNNAEYSDLQTALDWVCGQEGVDCGPIQQGGPCYDPTDLQYMASYVFNIYFLKHGVKRESCNFGNTADLTVLDPSRGNCVFPSSSSVISGSSGGTPQTAESSAEDANGCLTVGGWCWSLIIGPMLLTSTLAFLV